MTTWKTADESRTLHTTIRNRQTLMFGNIMRRTGLDNIVMMGKIHGSRGGGRPKDILLDGLRWWHDGISIDGSRTSRTKIIGET